MLLFFPPSALAASSQVATQKLSHKQNPSQRKLAWDGKNRYREQLPLGIRNRIPPFCKQRHEATTSVYKILLYINLFITIYKNRTYAKKD